ncbi:MAG: hypothetical protein JO031_16660 [Ktedonobacteraceae bacterium]|nr:hypothetical protein [Ktedonobacteraceae bacterium]
MREVLPDPSDLQPEELPFEDANTWRNTCIFLKKLYACLNACQEKGDTVYLSLAGGRKSMAALTAWVAPIFPCIKGLYHVIDKQEENFFSTADLDTFDRSRRFTALHPDLNSLILVKLPFERVGIEEQDFQKLHEVLRSETYDSMSAREFETDISIITLEKIREDSPFLSIEMTRQAVEQFITLRNENPGYARFIYEHIMQMGSIATLLSQKSMFNIDSQTQKSGKTSSVTLHSFTNLNIPVRPVFYTLPRDIYTASSDQVQRLIICSLEAKSVDDNRSLKEIAQTADFSMKPYVGFEALPPIPTPADSILIVPLGKFPMVATQLYTLLREQEHHTIHEVVLIYPKRSTAITNSADIVKKALREEYGFDKTTCVGIPDLKDITTAEHCTIYQEHLEAEIKRVKERYPKEYRIDLALSGGRKGMTAMTIFAALKNQIPYVYHTLITDDNINERIEKETTTECLTSPRLSSQERNDRLFLRSYETEGYNRYANFTLFRVPVFMGEGR